MLDFYVMVVTTVAMALLGLAILLRNLRNLTFRLFELLTLTAIGWFIANYLTNHVKGYSAQLFTNKLSLAVGFLLVQNVWLLSLHFPRKIAQHSRQRKVSLVLTPVLILVTLFTNQIVASVVYRPEKRITDINTGNLYTFYTVTTLIFFIFVVYNFRKAYRSKQLSQLEHQQVLYASAGLLLSFVWSVLTAAIIPSITHNWEISKYGAVGSLFIVSFTSYAIVRHKLFDIKLVVTRAIAYLLLVGTLSIAYAVTVFSLARTIFNDNTFTRTIFPVIAALLLAFTAPYLRSRFDKLTNRLFYRDAYDPQAFLDALNNVLVSNIELNKLLTDTAQVIGDNLKSEFCVFGIRETAYEPQRIIGDIEISFPIEDVARARSITPHMRGKVIVTDYIEGEKLADLKRLLQKNNIAILARLTPTTEYEVEGIGYLVLGQKKSGNPYNKQDIQTLEIVANELVIAIQNALRFEEIEKFNITLQDKVDDATRRLKKTNAKLQAMDETKDEFISMASHQLRTPLTSVKGYLSMVLEGDAGPLNEMQLKLIKQAFMSSQRMVYLIADLLNVSRLRTGKFVVENVKTNLASVVQEEVEQLHETAQSRSIELAYQAPKDFPEVMLDETKIRQVMMNFMDNAIYYTPQGGHITIELDDTADEITFMVKDTGIGVPESEKDHLFKEFYRADNAKQARPDGTGLGLFMAKRVIDAQGGKLIFESEVGKGSTFGFRFAKADLAPLEIADSKAVAG